MIRAPLLAAFLLAAPVAAEDLADLNGAWEGEYYCAQGLTRLVLGVTEAGDGMVEASFLFFSHPENPDVPTGCYVMQGEMEGDVLTLRGARWVVRPDGYYMVDISGVADPIRGLYQGDVHFPIAPGLCSRFKLRRTDRPAEPCPASLTS